FWNGVRVEDSLALVNLHQSQNQFERDPFILASQAKQVFYSREHDSSNWYVVLKAPPRGFHELEKYDEHEYMSNISQENARTEIHLDGATEEDHYIRDDFEGILI
ncbi:hypothetical protein PanWU01x14_000210, partial [Parasponia andersonii]